MALSEWEKEQVIEALDELNDVTRAIVLASLDAFAEWLANVLYTIYLKVKDVLGKFWRWLCSRF